MCVRASVSQRRCPGQLAHPKAPAWVTVTVRNWDLALLRTPVGEYQFLRIRGILVSTGGVVGDPLPDLEVGSDQVGRRRQSSSSPAIASHSSPVRHSPGAPTL